MDIQNIDIEKVALAAELDAGHELPGLRESLAQAKAGIYGRITTPEQIKARLRGRPVGSTKAGTKLPVKIRLSPDVLEALRATGEGWQTRIDETLRASLMLAGRLQ
jgi:uncharacterized protein (DUF4415 family)